MLINRQKFSHSQNHQLFSNQKFLQKFFQIVIKNHKKVFPFLMLHQTFFIISYFILYKVKSKKLIKIERKMQKELKLHREILDTQNLLKNALEGHLKDFKDRIEESANRTIKAKDTIESIREKTGTEKEHLMRESLLTNMMEIQDYKTIYNMCAASFIPLTIVILIENLTKYGEFLDFKTFSRCFSFADKIFMYWWVIALVQFSVIFFVRWIILNKISHFIWIPIYIIYLILLLAIPIHVVEKYRPGFGSSMVIMMEGVRMMLKAHSYLRTKLLYCTKNQYKNIYPGFLKKSQIEDEKPLSINLGNSKTEFRRFFYFFIAPTLIYRDEYKLNPKRDYRKICFHFFNFLMCTYYAFMMYLLGCKDVIEGLGKKLTFTNFCLSTLKFIMPSVTFLVLAFFGFLHSWLNGWAEITRFPDRCFYSDWWNSIQFGSYYRKWNIVVHDWLYYYLYLDFCRFFGEKFPRGLAKILTFLISAIIHEIIVIYAIGFFYPILSILFLGPGILLMQNQKRLKIITINFFFWIEMYLGTALIFVTYLTEYYARSLITNEFMENKWGVFAPLIPRTIYLREL